MATLAEIRSNVDAKLVVIWGRVLTWQAAYLAANGRYWQGLINPPALPADNNEVTVDLTRHPTDQLADWAAANLIQLSTLPMTMQIDTHNGPLGKGYTGTVTVKVLGKTYQRSQGFGPHSVTVAWREIVPTLTGL